MVMFDSLNRRFLPPYGCDFTDAPNFSRLAQHSAVFHNCYGGSMPCMPARREMHTGRYNFLHRSWGPLEPFDDSVPEMLRLAGVYTHLATDHPHYWEDGGATYHNRFSSFEFFRGQEGDHWKGHVADPKIPKAVSWRRGNPWRQDWINRQYVRSIEDHPQWRTVSAGLEFIDTNKAEDRWFLQIECFDPHEPFVSSDAHRRRYPHQYEGAHFDWPDYRPVLESEAEVEHARLEYSALLSMCDDSLGRVLDAMDANDMWKDTLLIVCTDHGFLLGERGWWGKNVQPWFDETIHTPLFVWDPRAGAAGVERRSLVQTVDLGPTLLDFFGVARTADMQGRSIGPVVAEDRPVREAGLFGIYGGHVCVTDGRHVYMRASAEAANQPLEEYTLMPTHMDHMFRPSEFKGATLHPPLSFSKDAPVLKLNGRPFGNPYAFGTLLYDLEADPGQRQPLRDAALELRMASLLVKLMRENDAPESQFQRIGLPATGAVTQEHLLIEKQWPQVEAGMSIPQRGDDHARYGATANTPLNRLVQDSQARAKVETALGLQLEGVVMRRFGHLTPWQLTMMMPGLPVAGLLGLDDNGAAGQPQAHR
jgi:arylsulfatase A-like enzyme